MNLDLNQDPGLEPASRSVSNEAGNLRRHFDNSGLRREASRSVSNEAGNLRCHSGLRRVLHSVRLPIELSSESRIDSNHLVIDTRTSQIGEGSVGITEEPKALGTNDGFLANEVREKRDDVEKVGENDGSFFDCTVCFSLAKDPVVTTCGHLFCWPCIYRWLHMRPDVKECPVCKGGVAIENITPIYGGGKNTDTTSEPELEPDASFKVPPRPQARRVESLRQFIQSTSQRIARRAMESSENMDENNAHETSERDNPFTYYSLLSSRGIRAEQRDATSTTGVIDFSPTPAMRLALRLHSSSLRRRLRQPSSPSESPMAFVTSLTSSVDETILQQALQGVDDGDSLSSVADRMNSESQVDSAIELDSLGRRNVSSGSGSAGVDSSENSHPSTRRRLI